MTYQDSDTYEPLEQRKAKAIREKRVLQLNIHIFQSVCAVISWHAKLHGGDCEPDVYKDEVVNQVRSIFYNLVELQTGKRPNKLG